MLKLVSIEKGGSDGKGTLVTGRRVVGIIEQMVRIVSKVDHKRGLRLIDEEEEEIARVEYLEDGIKVIISPDMFERIKTKRIKAKRISPSSDEEE